jgi:alkanesulfonate monooxygenase
MTLDISLQQPKLHVFSTSPQSSAVDRADYIAKVIEVARWSEEAGCEGILVYTDNSLVDPWLVAQLIIQNTTRLSPLVAVQPAYMHPYAVAKMVSSLGHLYGRKIYLNMVAGGFTNDPLAPELAPEVFVSGSSPAGLAAAQALGATAVKYPQPAEQEPDCHETAIKTGIRVGIIARKSEEEAWRIANERFPGDRKGQITHQLAMKTSDSAWHKQLSQMSATPSENGGPYWLWPFENYKTFCPYLVGSYERVALELAKYLELGHLTFILDIPAAKDELEHISVVFSSARQLVTK